MKVDYPEIEIDKILQKRLKSLNYFEDIDLVFNQNRERGDLSTAVAIKIAHKHSANPQELANRIIANMKLPKWVEQVGVAGQGFINFQLSDEFLRNALLKPSSLPFFHERKKNKVVVEYSSPNIAKPFGVGHLRSTIIGDAVANIYEAMGDQVIRVNHLGDWGTQFGKLIFAYDKWGDADLLSNNPTEEMYRLYVKFHSEAEMDPTIENKARYWFKKLEGGDEEAVRVWKKFSAWSYNEFNEIYRLLGIKFDLVMGESQYQKYIPKVLEACKRKGILKDSEGAQIIQFGKNKTPALLMKKDGATLYITRDLAALYYRMKILNADKVIYHVGEEQTLHFEQLFAIAKMLGWADDEQLVFAPHGLLRLPEGKMSTRRGNVIKLEHLLDEATARSLTIINKKNPNLPAAEKEKVAGAVGIGAIKYNDLSSHRTTSIIFDWDKILNFQGNSAPYLQYAYARIASIFRHINVRPRINKMLNDDEKTLALFISQFEYTVRCAADLEAPSILAKYLFDLAGEMSKYYEKYNILKSDPKTRNHRLTIIKSAAFVLKTGLNLLGIKAPNEI